MQMVCCVCWREKGENGWEKGKLGRAGTKSHGYCPECYQRIIDRLEANHRRRLALGLTQK